MGSVTDLSICMTTLNRASTIGATLESILGQSDGDVEVVIVDGGSTDSTQEIVQRWQRDHPLVRYYRQPRNEGIDRGFAEAVRRAQGEYCWFLPDDDILKEGAIAEIRSRLREGRDVIVVNGEMRDERLVEVLIANRGGFAEDRTYGPDEQERLLIDAGMYLSFIGGLIVRREMWLERDLRPFEGSYFAHIGGVFAYPLPRGAEVVSKPFVAIRHGNVGWSARAFEIWMFRWPRLIWSFENYSDDARSSVTPREPWRSLSNLLKYRAIGAFSADAYRDWLAHQTAGAFWKSLAWGISRCPGRPLNAAARVYCRLRGDRIPLISLRTSRFGPALKKPGRETA